MACDPQKKFRAQSRACFPSRANFLGGKNSVRHTITTKPVCKIILSPTLFDQFIVINRSNTAFFGQNMLYFIFDNSAKWLVCSSFYPKKNGQRCDTLPGETIGWNERLRECGPVVPTSPPIFPTATYWRHQILPLLGSGGFR